MWIVALLLIRRNNNINAPCSSGSCTKRASGILLNRGKESSLGKDELLEWRLNRPYCIVNRGDDGGFL